MERDPELSKLKISPAPLPADLPSSMLKSILEHWMSVKERADVPDQKWIDALSYPTSSLPFISIIEIEPDTHNYITRLSGTAICDAFGVNPTGKYVSEIAKNPNIMKRLDWCVNHRSHYLAHDKYVKRSLKRQRYQSLTLPYKNKPGDISRILSAFVFD